MIMLGSGYESIPLVMNQYPSLIIDMLKHVYFGYFNLVSSNTTTLGGMPAKEIVYTTTINGLKIKNMQFFALNNTTFYIITSFALANAFPTYLPTIQKMVSSFSAPCCACA